jgi:hypothetical protein
MLIVTLEGLCALQFVCPQQGDPVLKVHLPQGHGGAEHISVLAGSARQTDIDRTTWKPDIMVTVPELGEPIHLWFLRERDIEFGAPGPTTWVSEADRAKVLHFENRHPHVQAIGRPTHQHNGRLQFGSGRLAVVPASVHQVEWFRGETVISEPIAERLEWTGETICVRSVQKGEIFFDCDTDTARLAVANTRPGDSGLTHFHMYYDLLENFGEQFQIRYAPEQPKKFKPLDPIDGNCVPPGIIPSPGR